MRREQLWAGGVKGGKLLSRGEITNEPMNDFEADVFEALCAKGIEMVPQVG